MQNPSTFPKKTPLEPNWSKIMEVLGTPKQEIVTFNNSMDPSTMDGSWDFNMMAQRGVGMRRVACDIGKSMGQIETPAGFAFVCRCGHVRRVIDTETSFTCERPNAAGTPGCGLIWECEMYESEEVDPISGTPIWKRVLEERTAPQTGRKYMMPRISGKLIGEMRKATWAARRAAGQPISEQPQRFGDEGGEEKANAPEPIVVPEPPTPNVGGGK